MKKVLLNILPILLLSSFVQLRAQTEPAKVSDASRICLMAVIPADAENIPKQAGPILLNRLRQLSTANGYSSTSIYPQFILTANPVLTEKKVLGSAPIKIWVELETTLYIADQYSRTIFSTANITLKGVGSTDTEAYMDAFKSFKINRPDLKEFVTKGRAEIIRFYETRCDFIMSRVDMLVKTNQAAQGLDMLLSIPEVSKGCFDQAMAKAPEVFKASVNQQCQQVIRAAKTVWANSPNRQGADRAALLLFGVPPSAECYAEADKLLTEIKAKMQETERWERKQYTDQIDLMRQYIDALRDVGVAYGNGQPDTVVNFKGWLW